MRELKEIIKELREKHGNKAQVAKKLGIPSQRLGQYEQGRQKPKLDFFNKWKEVYNEDILMIQKGEKGKTNVSHETKNGTLVQNEAAVPQKPLGEDLNEMLEKVEASKDYFVIPRSVLRENYRLVALEQFQLEKEKLEKERDDAKAKAEKDRVYLEAQIEANRDLSRKLDLLLAKLTEVQKS